MSRAVATVVKVGDDYSRPQSCSNCANVKREDSVLNHSHCFQMTDLI